MAVVVLNKFICRINGINISLGATRLQESEINANTGDFPMLNAKGTI